jgi:FtsP/CotA-like multicopper oxidase with cupredoxin domain
MRKWGRLTGVPLAAIALITAAAAWAGGSSTDGQPAVGAHSRCHAAAPPVLHDGFPEPPELVSRNGLLDVTLRAAVGPAMMGKRRVQAMSYDGSIPGPTLVICAGDHVVVHLQNDLAEATNLHTHGFHVSPEGNSDNIFLRIEPHTTFTYEYDIPQDMSAGSYWYHPHLHPSVERQIFGGLAGAIVEEGGLDRFPALRHVPQRWIVLDNTEVRHGRVLSVEEATEAGSRIYVNGESDPTAKIRPGQLQRWRIFNASADRVIVLRLPRRQHFVLLAQDGHTLANAQNVGDLMIAPGSRRDVLVRGGAPGSYPVKAVPFAQFPGGEKVADGGPRPNQTLLTLQSAGPRTNMRLPTGSLSKPLDLRRLPIDRERTVVFSEMAEAAGTPRFLLNGMSFDPNRVDVTMKLGSVERWTLVNSTEEWHTFHIHTNDFQVVGVNGANIPYLDDQDNVALAPGSHTVILIHPTDFTGKFVFHCHVTFHEDHGMMATVQVVREPTAAEARRSIVLDGGLAIGSSSYGSHYQPSLKATLFFCNLHALAKLTRGR